ncbi:hypothetical protein ACLOJK_023253 [Asimina triloba]
MVGSDQRIGPPQNDVANKLVVLRHVPSVDDNTITAPTAIPLSSSSSTNPPWTDLNEPIQFIHHDRSVEPIQDPSRPQADIDHSSHPRQALLFRRQRTHLDPAPRRRAAFSSRVHLAIDSPHDVCFSVVTGRCLDRMIQATHLIGDSSLCQPPSTVACLDAYTAYPDACTTRYHRSLIARPTCTARYHHPLSFHHDQQPRSPDPTLTATLACRRGRGMITAAHADNRPRQH